MTKRYYVEMDVSTLLYRFVGERNKSTRDSYTYSI